MTDCEGILLLGTGPSTGVPQLHHIFNIRKDATVHDKHCKVCRQAWEKPNDPNRRLNVSIVLKSERSEDDPDTDREYRFALVDIGKTFRQAALESFSKINVDKIDTLIITHDHADAMGGLDDVRDVQGGFHYKKDVSGNTSFQSMQKLPLYLSRHTYETVCKSFGYIIEASTSTVPSARKVGMIDCITFESLTDVERDKRDPRLVYATMTVNGKIAVELIPVYHGGSYISMGFIFGVGENSVLYISDVSEIPDESIKKIDSRERFDTMIIDALFVGEPHFSHLCVEEALDFIERWRPRRARLVGFTCRRDYISMNNDLERARLDINCRQRVPQYAKPQNGIEDRHYRPYKVLEFLKNNPLDRSSQVESIELGKDGSFLQVRW